MKANGIKVFKSINLDIEEVAEFIENNGLSFMCNEEMNVEASEEDFNKLIEQFPELDYVELQTKAKDQRKTNNHSALDNTVKSYYYEDRLHHEKI